MGQKARSSALLMSVLYSKPLFPLPAPIKWGLDNEGKARQAYAEYIRRGGHPTIEVINCGFFIHPEEGWFGASPDGIVLDKSDESYKGLLELKCPYTKRDVLPEEAVKDPSFYCHISDDGMFRHKRTHTSIIKCNFNFMLHWICLHGVISASIPPKVYW